LLCSLLSSLLSSLLTSSPRRRFVRFFSKAPLTDAGVERLPAAREVQEKAEKFERLVLQAEQDHPSFKKPTVCAYLCCCQCAYPGMC